MALHSRNYIVFALSAFFIFSSVSAEAAPVIDLTASPVNAQAFVDRTNPAAAFNDAITTISWNVTGAQSCTSIPGRTYFSGSYSSITAPRREWKNESIPFSGTRELHMVNEYPDFTYFWGGAENAVLFGIECFDAAQTRAYKEVKVKLLRAILVEPKVEISDMNDNTELFIGNTQVITWKTTGIDFGTSDSRSINRIMLSGKSANDPYGTFHKYTIAKDIPVSGTINWKVGSVVPGSLFVPGSKIDTRGIVSDAETVPPGTYDMFITITGDNVDGDAVGYGQVKRITIKNVSANTPAGTGTQNNPSTGVTTPTWNTTTSTGIPATTPNTSSLNVPSLATGNVQAPLAPALAPITDVGLTLKAIPATISVGGKTTIEWSKDGADRCLAAGSWAGTKQASGSESVSLTKEGLHDFLLVCLSSGKVSRGRLQVQVSALNKPQVAFPTQSTQAVSQATTIARSMQVGSKDTKGNTDVSKLQEILRSEGYLNSAPTGYYGALTSAAVKKYQRANKIDATGTVGPKTRSLLNATLHSRIEMSAEMLSKPVTLKITEPVADSHVYRDQLTVITRGSPNYLRTGSKLEIYLDGKLVRTATAGPSFAGGNFGDMNVAKLLPGGHTVTVKWLDSQERGNVLLASDEVSFKKMSLDELKQALQVKMVPTASYNGAMLYRWCDGSGWGQKEPVYLLPAQDTFWVKLDDSKAEPRLAIAAKVANKIIGTIPVSIEFAKMTTYPTVLPRSTGELGDVEFVLVDSQEAPILGTDGKPFAAKTLPTDDLDKTGKSQSCKPVDYSFTPPRPFLDSKGSACSISPTEEFDLFKSTKSVVEFCLGK